MPRKRYKFSNLQKYRQKAWYYDTNIYTQEEIYKSRGKDYGFK